MILFIKHIDIEGPDILEENFRDNGFDTVTVELQNGDTLPSDLEKLEAVVSLGGPMNVYEEDQHPFLKAEDAFIRRILDAGIPFMGICLGSQILAKACGAKVGKSPAKEIGFLPVTINDDPLFSGMDGQRNVFHWHEDMSELPSGAVLLASSEGCPHQAFKVGEKAYGLQFHIEVTEETVRKWIDKYFSEDNPGHMKQKGQILGDYRKQIVPFHQMADVIINNFIKIIRQ